MKTSFGTRVLVWGVIIVLSLASLAFAAGYLMQARANQQLAETAKIAAAGQAATSAANSIIAFFALLLLGTVVVVGGVVALYLMWNRRRRINNLEDMLRQLQLYQVGAGLQRRSLPGMGRRAFQRPQQQPPQIIVIGGQKPMQSYPPVIYPGQVMTGYDTIEEPPLLPFWED